MRCCSRCGSQIKNTDAFCPACGAPQVGADLLKEEPRDKLVCELAYSGILFWVPLVFGAKNKLSRYCANQGLWVLIFACLSCWIIALANVVAAACVGGILGTLVGVIRFVVVAICILALLVLAFAGTKRALAIHSGEMPSSIAFFAEKAIIRQ